MALYPLKFRPPPIGRPWGDGDGEMANGPLAGRSLRWAVGEFGRALLGDVAPAPEDGGLPVAIRWLDAAADLPAHVDAAAGVPAAGKAWYVVAAEAGARLVRGLRAGTTAEAFRAALASGTAASLLATVSARAGQCHWLPAGAVHALGRGVRAIEIQAVPEAVPRRLDLCGPTGAEPLPAELERAVRAITFPAPALAAPPRSHVAGLFTTVTRLVAAPRFTIEKVRFTEGVDEPVPYDQPVVWIVLEGRAEVRVKDVKEPTTLAGGDAVLLPAAMKDPILTTRADCVWLEVTFPGGDNAS